MPSSSVLARAGLGFLALAGSLPAASAASLASLNSVSVTTSPSLKLVPPGSAIFTLWSTRVVAVAEAELVHHFAGQELGVAGVFDLHLAEHLIEDDLNVLVVDLHALAAIDVLHFGQQVLIERFFALDAEDVVRNDRAADQRIAGLDEVAGVDLQFLVLGDVVLAFHAGFVADDDGHLAAAFFGADFDGAGDFRQHGRIFGLAGLEDFRDAGQTAGDVHRAGRFARLAGEHAGRRSIFWPFGDFDTGLGGQVVEVEDLAVGAFDGDARMAFALVLDDDELGFAAAGAAFALFFEADGFAFFDVLVADGAALLGQNRRDVGVPHDQLLARLDLFAVGDERRWRRRAPCISPARGPWRSTMAISPLRFRATRCLLPSASVTCDGVDVAVLDGAAGRRP